MISSETLGFHQWLKLNEDLNLTKQTFSIGLFSQNRDKFNVIFKEELGKIIEELKEQYIIKFNNTILGTARSGPCPLMITVSVKEDDFFGGIGH